MLLSCIRGRVWVLSSPILVHSFYFDFSLVLMMSVTSNGFSVPFLWSPCKSKLDSSRLNIHKNWYCFIDHIMYQNLSSKYSKYVVGEKHFYLCFKCFLPFSLKRCIFDFAIAVPQKPWQFLQNKQILFFPFLFSRSLILTDTYKITKVHFYSTLPYKGWLLSWGIYSYKFIKLNPYQTVFWFRCSILCIYYSSSSLCFYFIIRIYIISLIIRSWEWQGISFLLWSASHPCWQMLRNYALFWNYALSDFRLLHP